MRGQQPFTFRPASRSATDFRLGGLAPGMHQGYLKIAGEDALACDDTRWFTVEVRPAVASADRGAARRRAQAGRLRAVSVRGAGARRVSPARAKRPSSATSISTDELAKKPLDDYAAVCLLDPRPLAAGVWQKLHSLCRRPAAGWAFFWAATPRRSIRSTSRSPKSCCRASSCGSGGPSRGEVYLAPENLEHPLLAKFRRWRARSPGIACRSFAHWQLGTLAEGVGVVLPYSEQPAGAGRAAGRQGARAHDDHAVSDPASGRDAWNLLPTGEEPWPFVMLANEMMYLSGRQRAGAAELSGRRDGGRAPGLEPSGIRSIR